MQCSDSETCLCVTADMLVADGHMDACDDSTHQTKNHTAIKHGQIHLDADLGMCCGATLACTEVDSTGHIISCLPLNSDLSSPSASISIYVDSAVLTSKREYHSVGTRLPNPVVVRVTKLK